MSLPPKNPSQARVQPNAQGVKPMNAPQGARPAGAMQGRPMQPNPNRRPAGAMQGRPMQPNPNRRPTGAPVQRQASSQNAMTRPAVQSVPQEAPQQSATQQAAQRGRYEPNFASDFNLPPSIIQTKGVMLMMACVLFMGLLVGMMMGGAGGSQPAQQQGGLRGVIRNKDITVKMPRCGLTDPGQACLLYIMNSTRYDKIAEDFFDEAVKLMGVQKYSIQMVNPVYAKDRIPPGYFAEIKIPNVR